MEDKEPAKKVVEIESVQRIEPARLEVVAETIASTIFIRSRTETAVSAGS